MKAMIFIVCSRGARHRLPNENEHENAQALFQYFPSPISSHRATTKVHVFSAGQEIQSLICHAIVGHSLCGYRVGAVPHCNARHSSSTETQPINLS